jgi:predicted MPP superfamily phosphohydrolase
MVISRRSALKALLATGVGAATGGSAYGMLYGRHALELTRAELPVTGLPSALAGLRIGLITDVHRSQWVSAEDVNHAVGLLMSAQPDLVVLGGDFVTWGDRKFVGPSAEALSALHAPHGVFAILGNHDDDHDMPAALTAGGAERIRNESLELVGIRYWTRRASDISAIVRGASGPVVLLAHDPRRLTEAAALRIPLVLSGHTHGGQVVLPVIGAVAARKFPVISGIARQDDTTIFVSRGVGTVYVPVRINCPPEVALLTLAAASST